MAIWLLLNYILTGQPSGILYLPLVAWPRKAGVFAVVRE